MAPPSYPELGKLARDVFKRGYHPGIWQIETKTLTKSGIELFSSGFATHDNTKVNGTLQSKYKMEDHGLTLTEGWNTDKWLFGEIMHKDKLAEGLMLALAGRFQPSSHEADGKFKVGYAQEKYNILADMGLSSEPVLNLSAVMAHKEFLGGAGCDFDLRNVNIGGWKVALGWAKDPYTLHAELKNGGSWLASLFYKVNDKFDAAAEIAKAAIVSSGGGGGAGTENPEGQPQQQQQEEVGGDLTVSLGMIYHLDENALIRAKINTSVELGVGYEQKLNEGITASISVVLDGGNFSSGNHKIGVGVALQC